MSSALYYEPNSIPVPGIVTRFDPFVDVPPVGPNIIINPDLSPVDGIPQDQWKVFNGQLAAMTAKEIYQLSQRGVERNSKITTQPSDGEFKRSKIITTGINRFAFGTLLVYTAKSFESGSFNILKNEQSTLVLAGVTIILSVDKFGTLSMKSNHPLPIKYHIEVTFI